MRSISNYSTFLSKISFSERPVAVAVAVAVPPKFEASIISTRSVTFWIDFYRKYLKVAKPLKIIPNSSSCLLYELVNYINSCCRVLTDFSATFTCPTATWKCSLHSGK